MLSQGTLAPVRDVRLPEGAVLLVFFKVSCPTCQLALPFLERLHLSGKLAVIGISQDDDEDTGEFCRRFGLTFSMIRDDESTGYPLGSAFEITNVPSIFLLSAERRIELSMTGFSRSDLNALGEAVGAAVFEPGENVPEWKPG